MCLDFESRPTGYGGSQGQGGAVAGPEAVPDPQLHCHAFAFAPTWTEGKQRWQAGEFGGIKADGAYFEAVFHNRLAAMIRDLGYATVPTAGGRWWEIAGISRRLIEKFSRRSAEIRETAYHEGIVDAAELDKLGALTRQGKSDRYTLDELRAIWRSRLSDEDTTELDNAGRQTGGEAVTGADAIAYALDKLLERSSVVEMKPLLTEALRVAAGQAGLEDLIRALKSRKDVLRWEDGERTWITTKDVAAEEGVMCRHVRDGMASCQPLKAGSHEAAPVIAGDGQTMMLSDTQQQALAHILASRDAVIAVRGVAGSGKTTMLREAVAAIAAEGKTVYSFAPTTAAADVLRKEGFESAATLQKLLASKVMQDRMRDQVILVDEAGLVSVRQMKQLTGLARAQNARLILIGDEHQHGSVERSDINVLRILRDHAGLRPAKVSEIRRQHAQDYRGAVAALSQAEIAAGFERLGRMGAIREISDHMTRYRQLAADYFAARDAGKSALIIAPSHAEGDMVTALVREELRARGVLTDEGVKVRRLRNLNWTAAERAHAAYYLQDALVVEFTQNARGIKRGARFDVAGFDGEGHVLGRDANGSLTRLPLEAAERFQVYAAEEIELAVGETIRLTRNGEGLNGERLVNGAAATIAGFTEGGDIVLEGGTVIARDGGHLAYGYVSTSHKAQGVTADAVFIAENPACGAVSPEQLYVSVSRGRETVRLYTPDQAALLHAVSRQRPAMSATVLARKAARRQGRQRIAGERRLYMVDAERRHREWQHREALREKWPEGRLKGLWKRESGRVANVLRRTWHGITGRRSGPLEAGG